MPYRLLARRLVLASLDAAVRKARRELWWCRLGLRFLAATGRDTTTAEIVARRAGRRLALLLEDRRREAARAGARIGALGVHRAMRQGRAVARRAGASVSALRVEKDSSPGP